MQSENDNYQLKFYCTVRAIHIQRIAKDDVSAPMLAARAEEAGRRACAARVCGNARLAVANEDCLAASARRLPSRTASRLRATRVARDDDDDVRKHADGAATAPPYLAQSI